MPSLLFLPSPTSALDADGLPHLQERLVIVEIVAPAVRFGEGEDLWLGIGVVVRIEHRDDDRPLAFDNGEELVITGELYIEEGDARVWTKRSNRPSSGSLDHVVNYTQSRRSV